MSTSKFLQDTEGEWTGPKHVMFCGIRVPGWIPVHPDTEKDLSHFPTRKDDLFIVSYPKSGAWDYFLNPFTPKFKMQILPTFQEEIV